MKKTILTAAVLLLAWSLSAAVTVTAPLKQATVFLNGAELLQQAQLQLAKGDNEILIEGLSPQINHQSLQVALSGGVVVSSYEYGIDYLSADKKLFSTKALEDSLAAAKNELSAVKDELATLQKMQELLQTGVGHSLNTDGVGLSSETIEKNITYYQKRALQLASQKMETERRKTALDERISLLQKQIRQNGTQNARRSGVLTLVVNSPVKQTVSAEVKYFTPAASWHPTYDLNITSVNQPVSLVMKAHVQQTTGLDWQKVRLTLSTGSPARSNQAPELTTWWLRQQQPVVYGRQVRTYAAKAAVEPMMLMADAVAEDESAAETSLRSSRQNTVEQYVETNAQQLSMEYAIDLPYTILGNGKEQTIALLEKKIENVEYKWYTAPRVDQQAYLTANIRGWEQLDLLDGNANLTYNGTFYGQTWLAANPNGEQLRLTLGDDPQIAVKREKMQDYTVRKTVGQSQTVTYAWKTTLRNSKKEVVQLTLKDQYPVSTAKEIQVALGDKTTRWTDNNTEKGILTYDLTLQPGEQQEIVLVYTVKYPKDWNVNF